LGIPDRFGTTARPGRITWEREARVFEAEFVGSDICLRARLRHTYRLDDISLETKFVGARLRRG
jgi:tRNA A-37 threonylcarbamoyl transferase component Bud32